MFSNPLLVSVPPGKPQQFLNHIVAEPSAYLRCRIADDDCVRTNVAADHRPRAHNSAVANGDARENGTTLSEPHIAANHNVTACAGVLVLAMGSEAVDLPHGKCRDALGQVIPAREELDVTGDGDVVADEDPTADIATFVISPDVHRRDAIGTDADLDRSFGSLLAIPQKRLVSLRRHAKLGLSPPTFRASPRCHHVNSRDPIARRAILSAKTTVASVATASEARYAAEAVGWSSPTTPSGAAATVAGSTVRVK